MSNTQYNEIYLPNHPKAHQNGYVYEHILIAEQKIGRYLTEEEVVHHIDENKKNNSPDNLIVFATNADHTRFHKLKLEIEDLVCDNSIYKVQLNDNIVANMIKNYSIKLEDFKKIFPEYLHLIKKCEICGKECLNKYCSQKCCHIAQSKFNPTKEELLKDVLSLSMVKIGEKYGVSDNAVRNRCKRLGLPYKFEDIKKLKENN